MKINEIETVVGTIIIPNQAKTIVDSSNKSKKMSLKKEKEQNNLKRISNFEKILQDEIDKLK